MTSVLPRAGFQERVEVQRPRRTPRRARGMIALGCALALHAAPLVFLINFVSPAPIPLEEPPVIAVELVRTNAAPPRPPSEQVEGPKQVQAAASRAAPQQIRPRIQADAPEALAVPVTPPAPRPAQNQTPAPETTAPVARPAPPAPRASTAPQDWRNRLLAHLDSKKRYPPAAQRLRQEGVAYLRFTMDRSGRVLSSRIDRSSGRPLLDREALAMLGRAQPLPPPPDDVPGATLELVTPVEFFLPR